MTLQTPPLTTVTIYELSEGLISCYRNWIWIRLPDTQQSQSTDPRLW